MPKPSNQDLMNDKNFFEYVARGQTYNTDKGVRSTAAINGVQQYAASTHSLSDILQGTVGQANPADTLLLVNKALTDRLTEFDEQNVTAFSTFSSKDPLTAWATSPGTAGSGGSETGAGGPEGEGGILYERWVMALPLTHPTTGALIWQGSGKASSEMHLPTSTNLEEDVRQHKQLPNLPPAARHPWYMDRIGGPIGGETTGRHTPETSPSRLGEPANTPGQPGAFGILTPEEEQWYCLPKHTPVSTPDGQIPISELEIGQEVYSYDINTGLLVTRPVVRKEMTGNKRTYQIRTKSSSLEATAEHKVFVIHERGTDYSWTPVADLRIGDFLVLVNNETLKITLEKIQSVAPMAVVEVWDIEVYHSNCFFAERVLVHNCSMAWPYKGAADSFRRANRPDLVEIAKGKSQSDYKGKKIMVYSKQSQKGVVCTPGDWGTQPYWSNATVARSSINGFYIGLSQDVHAALGTAHGAEVIMRFMPDDTPLGPYKARTLIEGKLGGGGTSTTGSGTKAAMMRWAETQIGAPYAAITPYRFGEPLWPGGSRVGDRGNHYTFPAGIAVYDCSGFVCAVWKKAGVDLDKDYGLSWSQAFLSNQLETVERAQLQAGDIVVYSLRNGIGHVVLYHSKGTDGKEKCIEASGSKGVCIQSIDWSRVNGIRRPKVADVALAPTSTFRTDRILGPQVN